MNIPNLLSISRIVLIPLFLYLVFIPTTAARVWALAVFVIASLTDILDGWSARRLKQETETGKMLDPLADKFLVISALVAFVILDPLIPLWMILVVVGRDVLITVMRFFAINKGTSIRTSRFGKVKTAFQMFSVIVIIMVLIVRGSIGGPAEQVMAGGRMNYRAVYDFLQSAHPNKWLIIGPYCLMMLMTILTVISGIRYVITNRALFMPPYNGKKHDHMWFKELLFTFFYSGYFPIASGTAGTVVAAAIYIMEFQVFGWHSWIANLVIVAGMAYPAIRLGDAGEAFFKKKDPGEVVLDEAMGFWITVLFYPFSWKIVIIAFFLFRFYDIIKPYPARSLQKLPAGLGIMIDDYIAGAYANLTIGIMLLVAHYFGYSFY